MTDFQKKTFLVYVALLSIIGLFASDMYLPALAEIENEFASAPGMVGLSISIYMAGFAVAQLFYGPISDQVGRKIPLIFGLLIFLVGTLGCAYSSSKEIFFICRFLQAVGICSAQVLWQPMVVDIFSSHDIQKVFSTLISLSVISPALAPLCGGILAEFLGWRTIFWVQVGIVILLLLWTWFVYVESRTAQNITTLSLSKIAQSYLFFFKNRFFLGLSIAISCGFTLYLVFLTLLPLMLSRIGYAPLHIGLLYLPIAFAFICGAQLSRHQSSRWGEMRSMTIGVSFASLGALVLLMFSWLEKDVSAWQLIAPFMVIALGNGFLIPTGLAYLMKRFRDKSGGCASATGFLRTAMAFVSTALASLLLDDFGIFAITGILAFFSLIMIISFLWARKNAEDSVQILETTTLST